MSRTLAHQIAARARELVSDPHRWTQGPLARTRDGLGTQPEDPSAYSFCLVGALIRAAHDLMGENKQARDFAMVVRTSIELLAELPDDGLIEGVNDCEGHAAVLDLLDR